MANQYWIVIKDTEVVAAHADTENLFINPLYTTAHNWYLADFPPTINEQARVTELAERYIESDDVDGQVAVPVEIEFELTRPKAVIPDPRLTMTLSDAKAAVKTMINARFQHEILSAYPLQLQQTITSLGKKLTGSGNYSSTDVTTMNNFINGKLTAQVTKYGEVDALSTNAAVIAYDVRA